MSKSFTRESRTHRQNAVAAVVNPVAGAGRSGHRWRRVRRDLERRGVSTVTLETTAPGHATLLTREAISEGYRTILAVGGDGTFHEVVNGLAVDGGIRDDVLVGCLPAGTGMDFARNLPFPRRLGMVSDRIVRGFERRIDIGLARSEQSKFFVNFLETGLGAEVVARASLLSPRLPGRAAFLISAIGAALKESNLTATIALDGQKLYQGPLVSVVVANGRYFGGGMKIAPHAKMDDGELDVLVLGDFTRAEMISQIWKIYPGAHLNHHKVLWARGRLVEVYPESPTRLDLDGELSGRGPYTVSVLPQALRVIA